MIALENVCKAFPLNGGRLEVLRGISAEILLGGITAIVGRSGCGKTTLLRLLAGLDVPDSGRILLPEACRVATVFQEARLMPWLNCRQNVAFGLGFREKRARARRLDQLIAMVGLAGFEKAYPAKLSGGMQQRCALARALAVEPELILLDEPFAALDYFTRRQMQRELRRIQQESGKTLVLVTHNIDEALILGDQVLAMAGGRVARQFDLQDQSWPRDVLAPQLIEIKRQILSEMEGETP